MSLCQFLPINSLLFRYTEKVHRAILQIDYIFYLEEKEDDFYFKKICNTLAVTAPKNINVKINSMKGSVQSAIQRANNDLARIKSK